MTLSSAIQTEVEEEEGRRGLTSLVAAAPRLAG